MGLGQTMISVLFFALLMVMFVNAFRTLSDADNEVMTSLAYKTAVDLGQSLMAEIVSRRYDQNFDTTTSDINGPNQGFPGNFTAANALGPGAPEAFTLPDRPPYQSLSRYNDVDDYDLYSRVTDSTNGLAPFRDSVIVYYVSMTNPPTVASSPTWTKRIEVWVTQDTYLKRDNTNLWLKFYSIVTGYKKR